MHIEKFKEGTPTRQGFYKVRTDKGRTLIAEYREHDKSGKRWWTYVSSDPTIEKKRVALSGVESFAKVDEAEVEKFLQRERTRDEKIEDSAHQLRKNLELYPQFARPIPQNRKLTVGQAVIMGQLNEAKVAALHDGGQIVTLEYRSIETKFGHKIDHGLAYVSHQWLSVIPKVDAVAAGLTKSTLYSSQTHFNTPIGVLVRRMHTEGVSDSPDYQREYVWELEDKERFLDSLFSGRHLGSFLFIKEKHPNADVLFDGKQRMNTLLELVSSVLPYKGVYWHEMNHEDRHTALNRSVQFAELDAAIYSKADLLDIFLEVNAAGVPQTEEHLAKVRKLRDAERAKELTAKP